MPEELEYLLAWHAEAAAGRGAGQYGPAPLTYEGIEAWARLRDRQLEPFEVDAILRMDIAMLHPDAGED